MPYRAAVAALLVVLFQGEAHSQGLPCSDYALHPVPVARVELGVNASSIAAAGGYAYVADGGNGVRILDIHDPRSPAIIGTILDDDPDLLNVGSVQMGEGRLYVGVARSGQGSRLDVYDLADPASPALLAAGLAVGTFRAFGRSVVTVPTVREIEVLDLEDPLHPVSRGTLEFPGGVRAVDTEGDRIYAAVGPRIDYPTNALFVVTAGTSLRIEKRIDLPGTPTTVSVSGPTAYINGYHGMMIVDDTGAAEPGVHEGPLMAWDASFAVRGTLGFALGPGLWIYDLADPVHPQLVANARVPLLPGLSSSGSPGAYGVAVEDGYAFVVRAGSGLSVFAIKGAATDANWVDVPFPENTVFVHQGSFGYAGVDSTLQVFDVSRPSEPKYIASLPLPGRISALTAYGTAVFAGAGRSDGTRLVRVDVQDPWEPMAVSGQPLLQDWYGFEQILPDGDRIYVTGYMGGQARLAVIDVSSKDPVVEADAYLEYWNSLEGTTWEGPRMAQSGDFLYVTAYRGFRVLEKNAPGTPVQDAIWEQDKHLSGDIAVRDKTVFLTLNTRTEWYSAPLAPGDQRPGLRIFDASDPRDPREIGRYDTVDGANDMVMAGTVAYVRVTSAGITLFDVVNPRAPREMGYWLAPSDGRFDVVGGSLFAFASFEPWLSVSGPACDVAVPVFLLSFDAAWNGNAVVLDWRVAEDDPETRFRLDAVTGEKRREVPYHRTGAGTFRAEDAGEGEAMVLYRLYLETREGTWSLLGERGVPSPGSSSPVLAAFPNPFSAGTAVHYRVDVPGSVDLAVFDVAGRKVRTLLDERQDPGDHRASWDGRDDAGVSVAAGVYHLRLRTRDRVMTTKLVVRP